MHVLTLLSEKMTKVASGMSRSFQQEGKGSVLSSPNCVHKVYVTNPWL